MACFGENVLEYIEEHGKGTITEYRQIIDKSSETVEMGNGHIIRSCGDSNKKSK